METLEQRCSLLTWKKLTSRFGDSTEAWKNHRKAEKYLGALKKTPARIHNSGLGQALAFLASRPEDAAKDAGQDVSELTLGLLGMEKEKKNLLGLLRGNDSALLFLATDEAMRVIAWLSRYLEGADVKFKQDDDGPEGGDT